MKCIPAFLILVPLLAFGAAPGDLQSGKWVQVSVSTGTGSTIHSVRNCPTFYGEDCPELQSIMGGWSGGVFATSLGVRGSLLVWGGGHNDYRGNEIYAFDVATGLWSSLTDPVDPPDCDLNTSTMVGGSNSPCAAHTYDYLEFARSTNEFFKLGSSSDDYTVEGTGNVHAFNVLTRTWRVATPFATWEGPPSDDGEGATSAWDTTRNVLWWHGSYRAHDTSDKTLRKYDPATNAITEYVGASPNIDGGMAYAGDLDALVLIDGRAFNNDLLGFDLSSGTPVQYSLTVSGNPDLPSQMGFDYDPIARKFVIYTNGSSVFTLTPPAGDWRTGTWTWASVPAGPGSANPGASAANGTWGRFRYVPAMCGFIVVNNVKKPTYMYQLVGGGSGCTTPADAVDDAVTTNAPGPVSIPVMVNDTGFTDPVTVSVTAPAAYGTTQINGSLGPRNGISITYTPAPGYIGLDSFVYSVNDGTHIDEATVSLNVTGDTDGDGVVDYLDNCLTVANADQRDTNADGFGNICDPDFNNNGIVDSNDGALLKAAFGSTAYPDRDLNGNGIVDSNDGARLKAQFGKPPGPSGVVP